MYIILVICGWVPIAGVKLDFGIFYGTYCFSPLSFFVQYKLLRYRPSTIVASDGKQTCALSTSFHVMMLKPVQAENKNKQISWN